VDIRNKKCRHGPDQDETDSGQHQESWVPFGETGSWLSVSLLVLLGIQPENLSLPMGVSYFSSQTRHRQSDHSKSLSRKVEGLTLKRPPQKPKLQPDAGTRDYPEIRGALDHGISGAWLFRL
jgi:hypothetical protein